MTGYMPTTDEVRQAATEDITVSGVPFRNEYLARGFDRWLNEIRAEAWDEAETAIHGWYKTYRETLYTAPENPYHTQD